jgi:membrane associated rhomboid family serine protease
MSEFRYTRPSNFPPVIKNLIIINVLVWIAQLFFDQQYDLSAKLGMWPIESDHFRPYQIATHMFAHATYVPGGGIMFFHILFNMLMLWMFGKILENVWGPKRFLFFYLACGVGAAITHMAVQYFEFRDVAAVIEQAKRLGDTELAKSIEARYGGGYVVGASGAVMGVMVGFAFLFPNTELYLLGAIPVKAKWAILGLVALDLFGGINPSQGDNVAHFAHLGGAITGFIIVFIWNKSNRRTFY